ATYQSLPQLGPYAIWRGATARAVHGDRLTLAVVDLEPDLEVPEHHHENEQLGLVLKGHITMVIEGSSRRLGVGDTYLIPSDVPHSASTGADGATVIDVFAPVRADWEQVPRLDPRPGAWPD
ncbi:MAG: cupin domain-containing protein, partial [Candidatus Dormibacteraeota bacterium]|nr:cupin domain-containing protein [Candidatus Dormibacteraeota bacterium]